MNNYIAPRQLRCWLGHVSRMPFDRIPRRMLSSWLPSPRCRGAAKMTYGRTMKKATGWPRQEKLFLPAFVARILALRSRKSGYGRLLGCRSGLDAGPFEKLFLAMLKPKNRAKIFTVCSGPASQSIERDRISHQEGALDVRESRERRDKIVPNVSPERQENAILA